MTAKVKSTNEGITNSNVNTNTNHININVEPPKKPSGSDNWLLKAIVGGVIAIAVAMAIYVLQGNKNDSSKNPENLPRVNQIEGTKQN